MSQTACTAQPDFACEAIQKEHELTRSLRTAGRLLVAYSGGVDSAYLALCAQRALGADVLALTALSPSYPRVQREMAERVAREFGFAHEYVDTREMQNAAYVKNEPDRCYHCKSELFSVLERICAERGFSALAYGINADDTRDFRPGHRAAHEHGVLAPLLAVGLSKAEIRFLSRRVGLPTADLPASPCLASRLPYGTPVTKLRLEQIEEGERRLRALGFREFRLRHHGELARIEVAASELARALDSQLTQAIAAQIEALGFREVEIDRRGYRCGSLNEGLAQSATEARASDGRSSAR